MDKETLESLADEALEAFWNVVAIHYPEPETGDLSPPPTEALHHAAEAAIGEWVDINVRVVCRTCGSEFVGTINDSHFRDGECGPCEHERYKSQPGLLKACEGVCGMIYRDKNNDERIDFNLYEAAERVCREAITQAYGKEF